MRIRATIAGLVLILAAGACGDDDADSTGSETGAESSTTTESAAETDASSSTAPATGDLPFESGSGSYQVDGEQIDAEWVVRCADDDVRVSLVAWGGDGRALSIEVSDLEVVGLGEDFNYTGTSFAADVAEDGLVAFENPRMLTGPDGAWYRDAESLSLARGVESGEILTEAPWEFDGDRATGTFVAEGDDGTRVVSYDLSVPSDSFDCDLL